jgi:hypothetical protein
MLIPSTVEYYIIILAVRMIIISSLVPVEVAVLTYTHNNHHNEISIDFLLRSSLSLNIIHKRIHTKIVDGGDCRPALPRGETSCIRLNRLFTRLLRLNPICEIMIVRPPGVMRVLITYKKPSVCNTIVSRMNHTKLGFLLSHHIHNHAKYFQC